MMYHPSGSLLGRSSVLLLFVLQPLCVITASNVGSPIEGVLGEAVVQSLIDHSSKEQDLSLFLQAIQQAGIVPKEKKQQQQQNRLSWGDSYPRNECEDCQSTSDCDIGLICPRRRQGEIVPGCHGGESDRFGSSSFCTRTDSLGLGGGSGSSSQQQEITVFAPIESAFQRDDIFRPFVTYSSFPHDWSRHMQRLLLNQFVEGGTFSKQDIFNGSIIGSSMLTMEGQFIPIDQDQKTVAGQTFASSDNSSLVIVGSNANEKPRGIIHPINRFFDHSDGWINQTILDLIQQSDGNDDGSSSGLTFRQKKFLEDALSNIEGQESIINALQDFSEGGMTLLVPSDSALAADNMNQSDDSLLKDNNNTILYNMIPRNNYLRDLRYGSSCIEIPTLHPLQLTIMAHKSNDNGTVRYGSAAAAEVTQEIFVSNGLVHSTNQILRPPKLMELLSDSVCLPDYEACYKILNATNEIGGLPSELSLGDRFTIRCPHTHHHYHNEHLEHYSKMPIYVTKSLPQWSNHLEEVARKMILPGINTELTDSSLSGLNRPEIMPEIMPNADSTLSGLKGPAKVTTIDGVAILDVYKIWDFPSVPDAIRAMEPGPSAIMTMHSGLAVWGHDHFYITLEGPITVFTPPLLPTPFLSNEIENIRRNHIFKGNWYMKDLLKMDGKFLTSVNDEKWLVSVLDNNVFLQPGDDTETSNLPPVKVGRGLNSTGILANIGVVHYIDNPLLVTTVVTKEAAMGACAQEISNMKSCSPFEDNYYIPQYYQHCSEKGHDCSNQAIDRVQSSYSQGQMCSFLTCTCCRRGCERQHQELVTCLVKKVTGDDLSACDAPYCDYESAKTFSSDDDKTTPWVWVAVGLACSTVLMIIVIGYNLWLGSVTRKAGPSRTRCSMGG